MALDPFDQLFAQADARRPAVPVAVAGGADPTVLEALTIASGRGWVQPILAGPVQPLRQLATANHVALDRFTLLDAAEADAANVAVAEVRAGRAQLLMKGQIATPTLMQAVLHGQTGLRTGRVIGQIVLVEIQSARRSFLMLDTGITIQPTLEQKTDLLRSAVAVSRALGAAEPRVAVMAATEKVTAAMPETLDAAPLRELAQRGDLGPCLVDGPLSFDLAFTAEAGDKKRISSPVVGAADVLLFPNLLSANLTVKAIMYTATCRFGGVLCGTRCPVVFMSRADSTATRLHSLALALRLLEAGVYA